MINEVTLIGYLGNDPKLVTPENKKHFVSMRLATSLGFMKEGEKITRTDWHQVICFGRLAELCHKYLKKGSLVFIRGSLHTKLWEDQAGVTHSASNVLANKVRFLDRKESNLNQHRDESPELADDFDPKQFEFIPDPEL